MFKKISISVRARVLRLGAAALAVGLPLGLYIGGAQPVAVNLFPWPWGKLVHMLVYGLLAAAIGYASGLRGWRMALVGFAGSVGVGLLDEWHQTYLAGRHGQFSDVGFDALGAAIGVALLSHRSTPIR